MTAPSLSVLETICHFHSFVRTYMSIHRELLWRVHRTAPLHVQHTEGYGPMDGTAVLEVVN